MNELSFDKLPKAIAHLQKEVSEIKNLLLQNATHIPEQDQFLTVKEAAVFLEVSVPTIYAYVQHKQIPVMKKRKRLYFSKQELMEWVKDGRKKTKAEIEQQVGEALANQNRRR